MHSNGFIEKYQVQLKFNVCEIVYWSKVLFPGMSKNFDLKLFEMSPKLNIVKPFKPKKKCY